MPGPLGERLPFYKPRKPEDKPLVYVYTSGRDKWPDAGGIVEVGFPGRSANEVQLIVPEGVWAVKFRQALTAGAILPHIEILPSGASSLADKSTPLRKLSNLRVVDVVTGPGRVQVLLKAST